MASYSCRFISEHLLFLIKIVNSQLFKNNCVYIILKMSIFYAHESMAVHKKHNLIQFRSLAVVIVKTSGVSSHDLEYSLHNKLITIWNAYDITFDSQI